MVATLAKAASADYYVHSQASFRPADQYYTGGEEPDGVWWNPSTLFAADRPAISHGTAIDSADFYKLYNGFDPHTGERLTQNAGSDKRCPAYDLTFNADKTVSALWAIADPSLREEIERAHNDAVRVALEDTIRKHCSYTRIADRNKNIHIVPADLMAALFQHGASRSGDPHLHTHCVILNVARAHHDGKWRALHGGPLYCWQKAAGAVYRAEIAWLLRERLGIDMEAHGRKKAYTRIPGVPDDLVKQWSQRNIHITDTAARMGVVLDGHGALREAVQRFTRDPKTKGIDPEERHLGWLDQAASFFADIGTFVASILGQAQEIAPERIREVTEDLDDLPATMTHHEAVFRYTDIVEQAANAGVGLLSREARNTAISRVLHSDQLVRLDKPQPSPDAAIDLAHTRAYSSADNIQAEKDIHALSTELTETSEFGIPAEAVGAKIRDLAGEGYPLSQEQIEAISFAASPGRIAIIEGAAGSGKTTTLRPLADLYREQGCKVIGTAVPWIVSESLGNDLAAPNYSVAKLISMIEHGHIAIDSRTVIVVDEAGMLSSQQARRILRLGTEHGAKLIFAGDTEQQQPVTAGPGLRLIRDVAGSIRIDTMRRQQPDVEDLLVAFAGHSRETATLKAGMASDLEKAELLERFEQLPDRRRAAVKSWQVEASDAFRRAHADDGTQGELTRQAIEAYASRGRFHLDRDLEATLTHLVDDWHAFKQAHPEKSSAVIAQSNAEVSTLSFLMRERSIETGKSPPVTVMACRGRDPDAKPTPLEIAVGDRIRIGALHWRKQLFNGTVVTVDELRHATSTEDGSTRAWIRGRTDRGREVSFWHDEIKSYHGKIRLDYGYALTMASGQGMTVDRAFVLANQKPARETIYPAATRHRERLDFYIDRKPLEFEIREQRPEDEAGEPVTNDDVKAHLARRWSRLQPKEAAKDYMSEKMQAELHAAADNSLAPNPGDGARWMATNDNGSGNLAAAAARMRYSDLAIREGATAQRIGEAYRELMPALESWNRRHAGDGNAAIALDPAFEADFRQSLQVIDAAAPFVQGNRNRERLLLERGGMTPEQLQAFTAERARAGEIVAAATPRPEKPVTRPQPRVSAPADPDTLAQAIRADFSELVPDNPPAIDESEELDAGIEIDSYDPDLAMPAPEIEQDPRLLESYRQDLSHTHDRVEDPEPAIDPDISPPAVQTGPARPTPAPAPAQASTTPEPRKAPEPPNAAQVEARYRKFLRDAHENKQDAQRRGIHPYRTSRAARLVREALDLLKQPSLRPAAAKVLRNALNAYLEWRRRHAQPPVQQPPRSTPQPRPTGKRPTRTTRQTPKRDIQTREPAVPRVASPPKPAPAPRQTPKAETPRPPAQAPETIRTEPEPAFMDPTAEAERLLGGFHAEVSRCAAEISAEKEGQAATQPPAVEKAPTVDGLVQSFLTGHRANEVRARSASISPYATDEWPALHRSLNDLVQRSDVPPKRREVLVGIHQAYRDWRLEQVRAEKHEPQDQSPRQSHRFRY